MDLDWEYPADPGVPEDKERFVSLLTALKESFSPDNLLLTIAVSCSKAMVEKSYDVPAIAATVDFVNFMSYGNCVLCQAEALFTFFLLRHSRIVGKSSRPSCPIGPSLD